MPASKQAADFTWKCFKNATLCTLFYLECARACSLHSCAKCMCVRAQVSMGCLWKNDSVFQSGACLPSVQTSALRTVSDLAEHKRTREDGTRFVRRTGTVDSS